MSQYDFGTIDPYTDDGVTLADMLNNWRDAIHSWHRGAARPSYAVPGMAWINDVGGPTNWLVMVYLGPSVGDAVLFAYDTTTGVISSGGGNVLASAAANPSVRWNATGNGVDLKGWRATVPASGILRFASYNDAGAEIAAIQFTRDGKLIADLSAATGLPATGVFTGLAPPASPVDNQLWWFNDSSRGGGQLYLYYNDGNTRQWVPAAASAVSPTPIFGKSFVSGGQTITAGGGLTIAHGLGAQPSLVIGKLHCVTSEGGYTAGQEIVVPLSQGNTGATSGRGIMVQFDATNLVVRFGNAATPIEILNGATGASFDITPANWTLVLSAFSA